MSRDCVSGTMQHILCIGFTLNLFSHPCFNSPGRIGGIIHSTRRVTLTGRVTSRDTVLLRGGGGVLPLSLSGCGSVIMVKPGDGRAVFKSCT